MKSQMGEIDRMTDHTRQELIQFLEERDEQLRETQEEIAENHEPESERHQMIEKVEKRREEARFIKRLVSHNMVKDYPELPPGWEH